MIPRWLKSRQMLIRQIEVLEEENDQWLQWYGQLWDEMHDLYNEHKRCILKSAVGEVIYEQPSQPDETEVEIDRKRS